MELKTNQLNQNSVLMQSNQTFNNERSCFAYLVFRDNADYERFLIHFDQFISKMPRFMHIEKLLCASFLTCELRVEGNGSCQSFRESIVEAYNNAFYNGLDSKQIEESFDHFWSHPDFIIHTIEVDGKKNFDYVHLVY